MRKVTVDEIPELRAYEAQRNDRRCDIIALKRRRRVSLGPFITIVFENTETVRWQITEMMRAERIATDAGIATELAVYNELIPDDDELSCTMFLELTNDDALHEWLPKLVGIHEAVAIELSDGSTVGGADPNAVRLTRDTVTTAVHYLKFRFSAVQLEGLRHGATRLIGVVSHHGAYAHRSEFEPALIDELLTDIAEADHTR